VIQGNTGYAGYFTNTSTTAANYGIYATDVSASGYAGYFSNTITATGYALFANGTAVQNANGAKLATSATGGFMNIAQTNGTPAGTPTLVTGSVPITVNNNGVLYAWNTTGSAWVAASGGGGTALSALTAATATNSIDNVAFPQTWTWNTLASGTAMTISSSSMTTGTLLSLQDTAVANTSTGKVLSISDTVTGPGYGLYSAMTGHGNTGYAGYFTNTDTGADANYGVYGTSASSSGYGVYANNSSTGYALYANGTSYLSGTTTFAGAISATGLSSGTIAAGKYMGLNSSNQVVLASAGGAGSASLSSLTAATTTNSIDNVNWAQTWTWNSLSTGTALTLSTTSMTTGTLLSLQDSAVANTSTGKVLSISNTTTGPGYGLYSSMSGTSNTGYAGYFTNTNTSTGYAIYAAGGISYFANNVGIGVSPSYALDANGGEIRATDFISTSDRRQKKNIRAIEGLTIVRKINGVRFNWISNNDPGVGVIAQDVEAVLPEAVSTDPRTGYKSVQYGNLIAPVIEAVKELDHKSDDTDARIAKFEEEIAALHRENEVLKKRLDDTEPAANQE
jgi:hypothetical protein